MLALLGPLATAFAGLYLFWFQGSLKRGFDSVFNYGRPLPEEPPE
jgi:hypothetical protein